LGRVLLPGRGPLLLVGVLGSDLEQEPHAGARDGEFEVAVLLVAARVTGEGDPRVVGRVHRPPRVPGDVRERGLSGRALELGREAATQRIPLDYTAPADLLPPL